MVRFRRTASYAALAALAPLVIAAGACGRASAPAPAAEGHLAAAPEHNEQAGGAPEAGTISLSPEARANIGLAIAFAEERVIERTLLVNATLKVIPDREAFVSSRVQGKVTEVRANVGDVVGRGEPLVRLQSLQIAETPPTLEVLSPLDGVVLERSVTVGQTIDASTSLMHVADLSHLLAQADVYETDLASVRLGQPVRLTVAAFRGQLFTGRIVRLSDIIDPERRTLRVFIDVRNTRDRALKPEMFAQVSVIIGSSGRLVAVPNEAVQSDGAERFVFVQNGDGYLRQNVVVGERNDQYTAIRSGIVAGDMVVTRGAAELKTVALQPMASGVRDESKPHSH